MVSFSHKFNVIITLLIISFSSQSILPVFIIFLFLLTILYNGQFSFIYKTQHKFTLCKSIFSVEEGECTPLTFERVWAALMTSPPPPSGFSADPETRHGLVSICPLFFIFEKIVIFRLISSDSCQISDPTTSIMTRIFPRTLDFKKKNVLSILFREYETHTRPLKNMGGSPCHKSCHSFHILLST